MVTAEPGKRQYYFVIKLNNYMDVENKHYNIPNKSIRIKYKGEFFYEICQILPHGCSLQ